jgi:hypothetical protein
VADRAQSGTLGFATVFTLVLFVILTVSAAVYPAMQDARDRQNVAGVERGFDLLAGNVDDVVAGDAPSRTTTLRLAGGSVSFGDPVTMTVTVDGSQSVSVETRPLVYRAKDGTELAYVGGAVLRDDGHGTVMVAEPRQFVVDDRAVLPLVRVGRGDGPGSVGSSATMTVGTVHDGSNVTVADRGASTVTLAVTSPRADAWARALDARDGVTCSLSGDTATCEVSVRRVHVTVVDVAVRLG